MFETLKNEVNTFQLNFSATTIFHTSYYIKLYYLCNVGMKGLNMMIYKDILLGVDPPASDDIKSGEGFDDFIIFNHNENKKKIFSTGHGQEQMEWIGQYRSSARSGKWHGRCSVQIIDRCSRSKIDGSIEQSFGDGSGTG